MRFIRIGSWGWIAMLAQAALAQAPAPILQEISPAALQAGVKSKLTLAGKSLEKVSGLLFDSEGFQAELSAPAAGTSTLAWDVTAGASVAEGFHDVRAVNALGVSAPRTVLVSRLPVVLDKDPEKGNAVDVQVESSVYGHVEAGDLERFHLKVARAQRIVVECFGERIDSKIDATLEVHDAAGRRVAFSRDRISLDPALAFDAKEGEEYSIELWDFTYRGKFQYLLSISTAPRFLFVYPPAAVAGESAHLTVYGWNLPGEKTTEAEDLLGSAQIQVGLGADASREPVGWYRATSGFLGDVLAVRPPTSALGPLLLAAVSRPPVLEKEPNDKPADALRLELPFEACGRFDMPGDRDEFLFQAKKGDALEIEIRSARLGAPCDPVILVARREKKDGAEKLQEVLYLDERKNGFPREDMIQRKFVEPSRDPSAVWSPPEDGEYLIQVRNRNGRHGPGAVYSLSVRAPVPGFVVAVTHAENVSGEAPCIPRGASQSCDVLVDRSGGFAGGIEIEAEGLPPGVTCAPTFLGPDESYGSIVFSAAADAPPWTGSIRVAANAAWKGAKLHRDALASTMIYGGTESRHPLQYIHSRLANGLPLAVRDPTPFSVLLEPAEQTAYPGAKLSIQARATRADGFADPIQLAYQGLGEQANAEENGNRPSKITIEREKTEQRIEVNLKKDFAYGDRSFLVYATAQVEYTDASDAKPKKERRRTTIVSNPVTVHVAPPFSLVVPDIASAMPAGGKLSIPFELKRLAGVEEAVEVSLDIPKEARGFSSASVKVAKEAAGGEIVLESDVDSPLGDAPALQLRARAKLGDKSFDERAPLPFVVRRTEPIRLALGDVPRSVSRGSPLEVPVRVERIGGGEGRITVSLVPPKDAKRIEAQPIELEKDALRGRLTVLARGDARAAELEGLVVEARIERNGKKFTASVSVPPVRVTDAFDVVEPLSARFGAMRLELRRQPGLRPGEDLRLKLKLTAGGDRETAAEVQFPGGMELLGVLIDSTALSGGSSPASPLHVQITLQLPEGNVTEDHVLKWAPQQVQ